jgi:hypothetical protein
MGEKNYREAAELFKVKCPLWREDNRERWRLFQRRR